MRKLLLGHFPQHYATSASQMMNLEKAMKEDEEKHKTTLTVEVGFREVIVLEASNQVVVEFKEFEKYKLATQDYEVGYDKGVEEIFFSI